MSCVSCTPLRTAAFALVPVVLFAAVVPTIAQAPKQAPIKLEPPLLTGPGILREHFEAYARVEAAVNRLLRRPCVTAAEQKWALSWAQSEIEWLVKYAKSFARTKEAEQEAGDYASILNAKYNQLSSKRICPPAAGTTPPTTPGTASGSGSSAPGSGSSTGGASPSNDTPPCSDSEKGKTLQEKYDQALADFSWINARMTELSQELAKLDKIVNDYEAGIQDPKQRDELMNDVDRVRQVNDARREAGGIRDQMRKLTEAQRKASAAMDQAAEELRRLGSDPNEPCDPKDSFMLAPAAPGGMFAESVPAFADVAPDSFDVGLGDPIVSNAVDGNALCCEPGVQKLAIHITTKVRVPLPQIAQRLPLLPLLGEWIAALGRAARGPQLAATRSWSAAAPERRDLWLAPAGQAAAANGMPSIQAVITSLGTSQGEAFQLQIVNDGPVPIRLSADSLVVEPLRRAARNGAMKSLQKLAPRLEQAPTVQVEGYCLNVALQPPEAGMLFRIAAPEVRAQFAPASRILRAAEILHTAGQLNPDTNPKMYLESIKQYALWTRLERWDAKAFTDAWVSTTRKQMTALKRQWNSQMEATLRSAAPGRWRDIQSVLSVAR